jgi:DNA-binding LytR/AlgR family response regulator
LDYNRKSNEPNQSEIWIKADNALHKLMINDIIMISSLQNYIRLHTRDKTYTLLSTLKEFKKQLPNEFIQCHKSFIVNKNHILRIEGNTVYLTQEEATISRNFRQEFITKVTQN